MGCTRSFGRGIRIRDVGDLSRSAAASSGSTSEGTGNTRSSSEDEGGEDEDEGGDELENECGGEGEVEG